MAEQDPWSQALGWQAYLEEATSAIRGNAAARAVREELRAHLEEARRHLLADGVPAEEAAARALEQMGEVSAVVAAFADPRGWRRAPGAAVGGALLALGRRVARWWRRIWQRRYGVGLAAGAVALLMVGVGTGTALAWRQASRAEAFARLALAEAHAATAAPPVHQYLPPRPVVPFAPGMCILQSERTGATPLRRVPQVVQATARPGAPAGAVVRGPVWQVNCMPTVRSPATHPAVPAPTGK